MGVGRVGEGLAALGPLAARWVPGAQKEARNGLFLFA